MATDQAELTTGTRTHIPSLNGVRALSFGLVFAGHVGYNGFIPTTFGVTIFFFLSGYLITTLMRQELASTGTVSLRHFYMRRALRILPPFYLVLILAVLASALAFTPHTTEPQSIWAIALHWSNYYMVEHDNQGFPPGTGVYWSLAVEEHFYLLFPVLFLLLCGIWARARARASILAGLCVLVLAWRCTLWFGVGITSPFHRTGVATDTRVDSLLFGCALALFGNPALDPTNIGERVWKRALFPLAIAGLLVCFAIRDDAFRETVRYSIQGLSLVPIFVVAIRYPTWWLIRPLNWRPVAFVGVLSYSLYLCHLLVLSAIWYQVPQLPQPVVAVTGLALSLAMAYAIYVVVEKPCARVRHRLQS